MNEANISQEIIYGLFAIAAKLICLMVILSVAWFGLRGFLKAVALGNDTWHKDGEDDIRAAIIYSIAIVVAACVIGFMLGGVYS